MEDLEVQAAFILCVFGPVAILAGFVSYINFIDKEEK